MSASIKGNLTCVMLLLLLVAGCGPAAAPTPIPPAVTQIPPTDTPLSSTDTPLPPTPTLTPLPSTNTPAPPTATATAIPPPPTPTATPIAESTFDGVRVTFVFNAGFLITVGDRRILIDAIYEGYPEGTLKPILQSQPPFDGVDLILATHEHVDHFSPSLVRQYMLANPNTIFASTQEAVRQLLALGDDLKSRAISIEIAKGETLRFQVSGITVEAIYLSHGIPNFVNLGLVVTIGDVALFHTGDIDVVDVGYLQSCGLPDRQLDIAFVPYFYFTEEAYYPLLLEGIQARYLIPMHYGGRISPSERFKSLSPGYFIFTESCESWVLPSP